MAEATMPQDAAPPKQSRLPLVLGIVLALALGGGGFYATFSGLILAPETDREAGEKAGPLPDIAFVPVDPVVISLGPNARSKHLRMTAQLEVGKAHAAEVTVLLPRILDVLNSYLRAIEIAQIEDPAALVRIRAQLLRRIQMVTGEGRVRDLLITEFVLN
jgi:flagellar protein FliL